LGAGEVLVRCFGSKRVSPEPSSLTRAEVGLAVVCVILNAFVAVAGIALWREGVIEVRAYGEYGALSVILDALVLFVVMDFAMYVLHRLAHHPVVYALAHRTHHRYESPRPLTLFVLNPFEVLGFGGLWLVVLIAYSQPRVRVGGPSGSRAGAGRVAAVAPPALHLDEYVSCRAPHGPLP
jgi:Delta7-sterol 5-desaturase